MQVPQHIIDHLMFLNSEVSSLSEKSGAKVFLVGGTVRDILLGRKSLDLDITVIAAPVVREESGLAISSRNIYLSSQERSAATILYQGICHAEKSMTSNKRDLVAIAAEIEQMIASTPGCRTDYVLFVDEERFEQAERAEEGKEYRLLLAAYCGAVRLIDNGKIRAC